MKNNKITYKEAIANACLNSKDVYLKLNLSKQTWSAIENYETQIKADALLSFCDLVNVEPRNLKIKGYE